MNKKTIVVISLGILVSLAIFVCASMISQLDGNYEVSIHLEEGWNIIAGTMPEDGILASSEIQLSDIKAMWYYSPKSKEYIRVHPNPELSKLQQADDDIVLTSAMWIYSEKQGTFKYSTLEDYPELNQRKLFSGWNFVSITSEMADGFGGSCNIDKAYFWDIGSKEWIIFPYSNPRDFTWDGDTIFGYGLIIKVSNDCTLGTSTGTTTPPGLPGENGLTSVEIIELKDKITQYYYDELSYEACELNNADEYTSKRDCELAWDCLGDEYAMLIPEKDLQELVDYMEEHGGESGVGWYDDQNPSVLEEMINTKYPLCLSGRHIEYPN